MSCTVEPMAPDDRWQRLHRRPIAWLKRHPSVADGAFALVIGVVMVTTLALTDVKASAGFGNDRAPDALAYVLAVAATVALPWRRRFPTSVLAAVGAATLVLTVRRYAGDASGTALLVASYSVAAHASRRRAIRAGAIFLLVLMAVLVAGRLHGERGLTADVFVANFVVAGTSLVLGDNVRQRRQRLSDLEARADRLEREQRYAADRAVAAERTRIARELHDVVSHCVSVMVVQAGAARRIAHRDPEAAATAMRTVEETGRSALDDLRRMLGLLRRADGTQLAALAPQPGIGDLVELLEADPTLPVSLTVEGTIRPLPTVVDVAAYRIAQEALTNVRKHAGPALTRVDVRLRYEPDALVVSVMDDGRGGAADLRPPGYGLLGMRERVHLCGGELRAEPRQGGGWLVRATLPEHVGTRTSAPRPEPAVP